MWQRGRFRFFFRGLPAGLIGVFPYSAIDMSTFEGIKLAYTQWKGEEPGIAGSLCFGAFSGGVGATSTYNLSRSFPPALLLTFSSPSPGVYPLFVSPLSALYSPFLR
jgi:hypothetical protein